jgi:hypothetical protein
MTIWDFANAHPGAFLVCVMFASWGFAWGVGGFRLFDARRSTKTAKKGPETTKPT